MKKIDEKIQNLSHILEQKLSAAEVYQSKDVLHISTKNNLNSSVWLHAAKEQCGLQYSRFSVLHEQPTVVGNIKFIVCGYSYVNQLLQEEFGGHTTLSNTWILYNEPRTSTEYGLYGFRHKSLPTAEEICSFIEKAVEKEPSHQINQMRAPSLEERLEKYKEN